MCGIIVAPYDKLSTILENQKDRGLDSLGIIDGKKLYKATRNSIDGYKTFIKEKVNKTQGMFVAHHRKATIGGINISNAHPFIGEKFSLMQNGTCRLFNNKTTHKEDVDSHNLLKWIEESADCLEEIPDLLDDFYEEFFDTFGILLVSDNKGNTLFISDGARESYIKIRKGYVRHITNYPKGEKEGFKNVGRLLFNNTTGKVIDFDFETEINKTPFKEKVVKKVAKVVDKGISLSKDQEDWYNDFLYYLNYNYNELASVSYYTCLSTYLKENFLVSDVIEYKAQFGETFESNVFYEAWKETF